MTKIYRRLIIGVTLAISAFLLASCGQTTQSPKEKKELTVMTTFYPMYDFAKQVVGDEGEVELLIPAGTEPHDYEPSAKDLAKITDADVFVYNSKELETWVPNVIENLDTKKVSIVEASQSIQLMQGTEEEESGEEGHEGHNHSHELDPHVWLDPVLAQKEVTAIALDKEYQAAFADAKNRTFVTQHAAFGYLAKQYGLTQEPIAGISPDQEPSPSRLAELKKYIKTNNVSVIYFEASASTKVAKTLADETGVELAVLNPLESLTQKEQEAGENYVSVMKENLAALQKSIH